MLFEQDLCLKTKMNILEVTIPNYGTIYDSYKQINLIDSNSHSVVVCLFSSMENQRSLENLLRDHTISADQFFQPKGIAAQIRNTNSMARFVKYCRTHRNFSTRMIYLGLNISSSELDDVNTKKASHAITELLGNQETQLLQLFFENNSKHQGETSEIPQELENSIRSQAQRLFRFDSDEQQTSAPQPTRPSEITSQQLTDLTFEILKNPEKNQTCLGYLQKMFSFFVRQEPLPVLGYLQKRPEIIRLLINNLTYSSISSFLAQILTSEDKTKQYKFQNFKKNILLQAIESIFARLQDQLYFDGSLIFLQQILNTSKQFYYQYFQDFKRIINQLVSSSVLDRFYNQLVKLNQTSFSNIAKFLQILFSRMNSQGQQNTYYQKQETGPPMKFQVQIFIKNAKNLVLIVSKIQPFNSLTKISYLSFLQALLNSSLLKGVSYQLDDPSFIGLFQVYKNEKNGGIVKNKIYRLINKILNKCSQEQIQRFLQTHSSFYQDYFVIIQNANYNNTKNYNKNQKCAFDISLITQLTKKEEQALSKASTVLGKDFKRICKKYDTKIASFQYNSSSKIQEQYNFCQFNSDYISKANGESSLPSLSLNFVGKNNISIPLLNLPQKNNTPSEESSQGRNHEDKSQKDQSTKHRKQVFEVQEVIVLTRDIKRIQLSNQTQNIQQQSKIMQISSEQRSSIEKQNEKEQQIKYIEKKQNNFLLQIPNLKQMISVEKKAEHKKECQQNQKQQKTKNKNEESVSVEKSRFFSRHLLIFA